jgi:hypothetical protein
MPAAKFDVRHRQLGLVVASAASVLAVLVAVALLVHPGRDSAEPSPAAAIATAPATSSDSPIESPTTTTPAANIIEPAASAAPASSPAATNTPSTPTAPASHRASPTPLSVAEDSEPSFKVNVQVSPTHVVWGHPVRVTVTVVDAGGVFDRPVVMFVQGSDPSDTITDAISPCTAPYGSISCPITDVRPGHTWSFTFTFVPGRFPGTDGFDDPVAAAFNYTDSHGQQQESSLYYAHVMLFDPPASSPPPASGAPSSTPPPSVPPASSAETIATPAPSN